MPAGILLQDEQGRVSFDGSQRIPKVLVEVIINAGDVTKTVSLPRTLKGNLYYYYKPLITNDSEPYYDPMSYNYRVSVSGTQLTISFVPYASWNSTPKPFKVYVGEY